MPLREGTQLGPYQILAPLGAGGMGEVFRARDPRLDREVAIKALPEGFAQDPERLVRFEREAKLLASLHHPNIAGIHGLEEQGGERYLVLEFVEGESLAQRLARGPLSVDDAIEVGIQIATALEAAHESGIVHRDLKPANIMLTPAGQVKVLDFGLAKANAPLGTSSGANLSASPTMTYAATMAGAILGTAAYMSPEQSRGKSVDRRTDIWSFGCVLFECLTGRMVFTGETVSDLVAQILKSEPDWHALPEATPSNVRRLLRLSLRKDPRERLRDIGDARLELGAAEVTESVAAPAAPAARRGAWWPAALAGGAIVALGFLAWLRLQPAAPGAAIDETSIMLPFGQRLASIGQNHCMAISPDGTAIAFVAQTAQGALLHVRRLDRREDMAIAGTDEARDPFFSPDGEWIGYYDSQHLMKVSVRGGTPVVVTDATQARGAVWLEDGSIVYSPGAVVPLYRLARGGTAPVAITRLDSTRLERSHRWPDALAGGPWVVFTIGLQNRPGDYDDSEIDAVSVKTGERRMLLKGARQAVWAAPDHLVFDRKGTLYAVRIDPRDPHVREEPVPVLDGVSGETSSGAAFLSFARDGDMAWVPSNGANVSRQVGWFDRTGRWTPTPVPPGEYRTAAVSPDGKHALLVVGPGSGAGDIWDADLATGGLRRLTYSNTTNSSVWFPDGSAFAYTLADSLGTNHLMIRRVDGAGGARAVMLLGRNGVVTGIAPGQKIIWSDWGLLSGRLREAGLAPGSGSRTFDTDANDQTYEQAGVVSDDGRWIAFISNRTGREEVFVRHYDGTSGLWQVSTRGGGGVRWGRAGSELFFIENEMLKSVSVHEAGGQVSFGQPVALFEAPPSPGEPTFRDYTYDPNTDRFLFTRPPLGSDERREVALSIGWGSRIDALIAQRKEKH